MPKRVCNLLNKDLTPSSVPPWDVFPRTYTYSVICVVAGAKKGPKREVEILRVMMARSTCVRRTIEVREADPSHRMGDVYVTCNGGRRTIRNGVSPTRVERGRHAACGAVNITSITRRGIDMHRGSARASDAVLIGARGVEPVASEYLDGPLSFVGISDAQ